MATKKPKSTSPVIAENKKAAFNYFFEDRFEAGMVLEGWEVKALRAGKAQLMLKGPLEWLGDFPAAGWHLTAAQLRKYAPQGRPFPGQRWLAASCHAGSRQFRKSILMPPIPGTGGST